MQSTPPTRYQHLQPGDRLKLASPVQHKYTVRDITLILGRSPSTISRELRCNAQPTLRQHHSPYLRPTQTPGRLLTGQAPSRWHPVRGCAPLS
ncbi:helix-turn-helix domain-containing protein [Hydrogenophaga sp.]|uniref:helix-turn-helix domain-containing protein n=1 Tax=Hydrogenophaga sp. TaxID=1904254 RepID=UPI003918F795